MTSDNLPSVLNPILSLVMIGMFCFGLWEHDFNKIILATLCSLWQIVGLSRV